MRVQPEEDAARLLREVWWWGRPSRDGLPVSPVRIAVWLGVRVYTAEMSAAASGALRITPGEDPVIYLNVEDGPGRQRFTCAHELGHFRKRVAEGSVPFEVFDRRDVIAAEGALPDEIYANRFAAALLMPAELVRTMWRRDRDPVVLALRFGVPADVMTYRIRSLGLRWSEAG